MKLKTTAAAIAILIALTSIWWFVFRTEQMVAKHIKEWANDPDSVVLQNLHPSKYAPDVWCGEVNARNRMGGMSGFQKFVLELPGINKLTGPNETELMFKRIMIEGHESFEGRYKIMCEN